MGAMADVSPPYSWTRRRRFMYAVVAFCMAAVAWVLGTGAESGPAETAVTMAFVTITGTLGSYVFGSTWEDARRRGS